VNESSFGLVSCFPQARNNPYSTNSGQNVDFWTFFETTSISAVSAGRQVFLNRKILFFP
jgi:hypothetical protein